MAGGQLGRVGGAVSHGHAMKGVRSREYRCWLSMRLRCRQKPEYRDRGIRVCAEWDSSFEAFLLCVGPSPSSKHTLDRWPNPNGNYEPGNVRWATMLEQRHNRRPDAKVGKPWLGKARTAMAGSGNPSAKLTASDVRAIREAKSIGCRTADLARKFSVSGTTIKHIVSRKTWTGVGDGHTQDR